MKKKTYFRQFWRFFKVEILVTIMLKISAIRVLQIWKSYIFFILRFSKLYNLKKNYKKFLRADIPGVQFWVLLRNRYFYENLWKFICLLGCLLYLNNHTNEKLGCFGKLMTTTFHNLWDLDKYQQRSSHKLEINIANFHKNSDF